MSIIADQALLIRLKQGNLGAFDEVVLLYERAIFNYLYRLTGSREGAQDLTQETFIKLYKKRGSINSESNFRSWLYAVATNTAYDHFRRAKRQSELFIIDQPDNPFETIDEEDAYKNIATTQDLERALAQIKPIYRTVLLLFYHEGLHYEEIANALAIPVNTIKTHLHRAKQALKEVIKDY